MTPETVMGRVFGVDPRTITDASSGESIEQWDSLGHVTLVLELETAFGVTLSTEDALAMTNVGAIKRILQERGASW